MYQHTEVVMEVAICSLPALCVYQFVQHLLSFTIKNNQQADDKKDQTNIELILHCIQRLICYSSVP